MSEREDANVGWIRLGVRGMVPPGAAGKVPDSTGRVSEDGTVTVHGITFVPTEDGLDPGTEVYVTRLMGARGEYARPLAEYEREQARKERRKNLKRRARERVKDWKQNRADAFWNQYAIPFQWDVAIKGRRSGLSRGSWGDGRAANTVEHLYVAEPFSEGRLSRHADRFLCDPNSAVSPHLPFDGVRAHNSDGDEYRPPVTCERCLDMMARWKASDTEDAGGDAR